MSRNSTIELIIVGIVLVVGILWYPSFKMQSEQKAKLALENKVSELDQLILKNHDCPKVVSEATSYLQNNPSSEPVLSRLGSCQFDLGQFADAKVSFQKVVAMDPTNVPAKNYLKQMDFKTGEVVVTGTETPFDKDQFESRMGVNFDKILTFVKVVKKPSNIPEYLSASYTTTNSFDSTISSLKDELKKDNINFSSSLSNATAIISSGDAKERKIIMLEKVSSFLVKVNMNYQKLIN